LKPTEPEALEKVQLRELKNGRLAMLASAGGLYTEYLTGNGPLEAWAKGEISPFGDGIGIY
jgi:Chlorophyll A-B binding protein